MLRKLFLIPALGLLLLPAMAKAEFQEGDWELTLSGSGFNGPDFDGVSFNVNGSLGYFVSRDLELGVRQSVGYTDFFGSGSSGSSWQGSTRLFADWHFDMGAWRPFIGANFGYLYGDGVEDTLTYAPEAGVKYFVNPTTFIFVLAEYQIFCDKGSDFLDDGQFVYSLGIGFRF